MPSTWLGIEDANMSSQGVPGDRMAASIGIPSIYELDIMPLKNELEDEKHMVYIFRFGQKNLEDV